MPPQKANHAAGSPTSIHLGIQTGTRDEPGDSDRSGCRRPCAPLTTIDDHMDVMTPWTPGVMGQQVPSRDATGVD